MLGGDHDELMSQFPARRSLRSINRPTNWLRGGEVAGRHDTRQQAPQAAAAASTHADHRAALDRYAGDRRRDRRDALQLIRNRARGDPRVRRRRELAVARRALEQRFVPAGRPHASRRNSPRADRGRETDAGRIGSVDRRYQPGDRVRPPGPVFARLSPQRRANFQPVSPAASARLMPNEVAEKIARIKLLRTLRKCGASGWLRRHDGTVESIVFSSSRLGFATTAPFGTCHSVVSRFLLATRRWRGFAVTAPRSIHDHWSFYLSHAAESARRNCPPSLGGSSRPGGSTWWSCWW